MTTRRTFIKDSSTLAIGVTLLDSIFFSPVAHAADDGQCEGTPGQPVVNWDETCDNGKKNSSGMYEDIDQACGSVDPAIGKRSRDQSCEATSNSSGFRLDEDQNCSFPNRDTANDPDESCHQREIGGQWYNMDEGDRWWV